ncbi:MAG TPA: R3H domain-containing nucleic acid-binding protein [Chroococcales cyanobacterium]
MPNRRAIEDLNRILDILPTDISDRIRLDSRVERLIEIVFDLGRPVEIRFFEGFEDFDDRLVTREDLNHVVDRVGSFTEDNRAGIERTLHRISAIRNRVGVIVGLTCRVGRAIHGTVEIIKDLVNSNRSILLMGRPGVGKTTKLREIARVLSEDLGKRVIVIDTSNEIAGDGDIPHPGIGRSRRMQVPTPSRQHAVMIEAVENHMPEVIVIDEIGTSEEAAAARTIAERGVQLIATAHGNNIENLFMNPTLSDLVGGIQAVTLSDEEARRRGTQKTVLERKAPPTFDIAVEIQDHDQVVVHADVAEVVDRLLRGSPPEPEIRNLRHGKVEVRRPEARESLLSVAKRHEGRLRIFPYAVSRSHLERVISNLRLPFEITKEMEHADAVFVLKAYTKGGFKVVDEANAMRLPVFVLKSNTISQIAKAVREVAGETGAISAEEEEAIREVREAIDKVLSEDRVIQLHPQKSQVRRIQHEVAERYHLATQSVGEEPERRVTLFPPETFD